METRWMIYGANGFTGELIAEEALRRGGAMPILAARSEKSLARWKDDPRIETRVFDLTQPTRIDQRLQGVTLVLNCAGPFADTAAPLMDACARVGAHYLDITGEIDVIEAGAAHDAAFKAAGTVVMPAVGFDVVPSDCLAALLTAELPGATQLRLAFTALGGLSTGTAKTTIRSLPEGGRARVDGKIVRVPPAWKTREIPFADRTQSAVTIPWGDVASAFYSTGIPNIEVYTVVPPEQLRALRWSKWFLPLLRWKPIQAFLIKQAQSSGKNPTAAERAASPASLWGRVEDRNGNFVEATLTAPNAYDLTVLTALKMVERVLAGDVAPGFQTPAKACGGEFILQFAGVEFSRRAAANA